MRYDKTGSQVVAVQDAVKTTGSYTSADVSAFGEKSVHENQPIWQSSFVYPQDHEQIHRITEQASGGVTYANQMVTCSSGNTAKGLAAVSSLRPLRYQPGQGSMARFTALFGTPSAGGVQSAGVSNGETGLLVGYFFNTEFSVWRQYGGEREVQTLTVTTGSSHAENITITLESVGVSVAVTNTGSVTDTAWEIAQGDYSGVSDVGYDAFAEGDTVVFVRRQAAVVSGTFSLSGATSAVGTFAQTVAGVATTTSQTLQSNFNVDTIDGNGPSGFNLDTTKGNVFQIDYQYLGFGKIRYFVETEEGKLILFHNEQYANSNTQPSLSNPSITWSASAYNFSGGAGNAQSVSVASASLYRQGSQSAFSVHYSASTERTSLAASRAPILSIKPCQTYAGRLFLGEAVVRALSVATTTTKPVLFELVIDGTLGNDADFQSLGGDSVMLVDESATTISGGSTELTFTIGKDGSALVPLTELIGELAMTRFSTVSLVATPGAANTDIDAGLNWDEFI